MNDGTRACSVGADDGLVLTVEVSSEADRSQVAPSGELDPASAPCLQQVLDQLCRGGYREIVLDLSGLKFLSAAGLTVFLRVDDQLRDAGGRLILNRPGPDIRRVLAITELDIVLSIQHETARSFHHAPTNVIGEVSSPSAAGTNRRRHTSVPAGHPMLMSTPTAWEPQWQSTTR